MGHHARDFGNLTRTQQIGVESEHILESETDNKCETWRHLERATKHWKNEIGVSIVCPNTSLGHL